LSFSYQITNAISYASRPLWDTPEGPRTLLAHYYSAGLKVDQELCRMHGWVERPRKPPIWDATIFSTELDLLEIRLNELDAVVDRFFIVESNSESSGWFQNLHAPSLPSETFTGIPKPLYFAENRSRYAKFDRKIVYRSFPGRTPSSQESPFDVEADQRQFMTQLLNSHMLSDGPPPLVIFADVDELPSSHTLHLLQTCTSPSPIHLQLRNYLYSFEWPFGSSSWRAQVHEWKNSSIYRHSKASDVILADSGWHCRYVWISQDTSNFLTRTHSYCFRYLNEFALKMQGTFPR
jgi:beta-1,4-mannosyl-glycoprotein beta-1,4-N-acetylglucosaminyltransferase